MGYSSSQDWEQTWVLTAHGLLAFTAATPPMTAMHDCTMYIAMFWAPLTSSKAQDIQSKPTKETNLSVPQSALYVAHLHTHLHDPLHSLSIF